MIEKQTYVNVIIPLALPGYFTYSVPPPLSKTVEPGKRVVVQFGKKKLYTAIIAAIHYNKPSFEIKEIIQIIDNRPIVNTMQLSFWSWLSMYYMCTNGEVMKAALPSGLKLESESVILPGSGIEDHGEVTEDEIIVIELLKDKGSITIEDIVKILGKKNVYSLLGYLVSKKIIVIEESITERYIPKYVEYIELSDEIETEEHLNSVFSKLSKSPKQADVLLLFASMSKIFTQSVAPVKKSDLLNKIQNGANPLRELQKKKILKVTEKEISRLENYSGECSDLARLNNVQQTSLNSIKENFNEKEVVLLHGVTSSGKTEIYIHLIREYLQKGKQVLYLLPEIALTSQIINRLRKVFGNTVGIYHSKFSDAERVETYLNVLDTKTVKTPYRIILGVRSSVFLPFSDLGLVIVDEEHENTYKQFDPAPRYNARDSALMLAKMHGAKVLLGSATPSIESYYHANDGRFGKVELFTRYHEILMPRIEIVDTREAFRKKQMKSHFSLTLLDAVKETIEHQKQVILFQNRRGFSPRIECDSCAWVPGCPHCDVKLTYHKFDHRLICHYCGFSTNVTAKCPACGSLSISMKGFGTERIEDDLSLIFPEYSIGRLDLDTARTRKKIDAIFEDFESGKTQILIGTQMISKGLDFDNVGLVGIINADNLLNFPDFRTNERSFQLMAQVSGRAGRKNEQGKVIIQTSQPEHRVIKYVLNNDFVSLFQWQWEERKQYHYPPFTRMIEIMIKHKKEEVAEKAAKILTDSLRKVFGNRLLGYEKPLISKIQTFYLRHLLLKFEREVSLQKVREIINNEIEKLKIIPEFKSVIVVPDVDPM